MCPTENRGVMSCDSTQLDPLLLPWLEVIPLLFTTLKIKLQLSVEVEYWRKKKDFHITFSDMKDIE